LSVVVIGGGLSGLFIGLAIVERGGGEVVVLDKAVRPGGVAGTIERDGFVLEQAVGSMTLPHPDLSPLLDMIGGEMRVVSPEASARHLFTGGRLVELRASPGVLLAPVVSWRARLRVLLEVWQRDGQPDGEETLAAFFERHFGREAGGLIAWLLASGVFAGDPRRVSVRAAFPRLAALETEHGSLLRGAMRLRRRRARGLPRPGLHYPAAGMTGLAEAAARFLGSRYRGGFAVDVVRRDGDLWVVQGPEEMRAESVVIATHPHDAAALVDDELGSHLRRAVTAPVAVVGLGGRGPDVIPNGFGALVGPGEELGILGILFESSYAPERAPDDSWLIKIILGGATGPAIVDDDRLAERAQSEAEHVLGGRLDRSFVEVVRHTRGIPQYEVGHERWLSDLGDLLAARPGLHLTGWGYRSIGITQLATEARAMAANLFP
jgi:oxygen-dependent protoporphyrinogen oxidase